MFESKTERENLSVYIGARVTEAEVEWLHAEMKRRKVTMSDLLRLALSKLKDA
jgi:hypothetical protein